MIRSRELGAYRARQALAVGCLVVLASVWGCGRANRSEEGAAGGAQTQRVGPYRMLVENRPARPAVGDNVLRIVVRDSTDRPLPGAEVRVLVVMQSMGSMPRMESRGEVRETAAGVYESKYGLAMAGEWSLDIALHAPGGPEAEAKFTISTSTEGIGFVGDSSTLGESGVVVLDPARRQELGVTTAAITKRHLLVPIRAAGSVAYDETGRADISLKFPGWVRKIHVDYTGKAVRAGMPLLSVYSPELLTAQQEYLEALKSSSADPHAPSGGESDLAVSARQRLLLWDVSAAQIDAIGRSGVPLEEVPIVAPVSGVVIEKNVTLGSAFQAGQTLYKIARVDPIWVVASIYQYELPLVREGMTASVSAPISDSPARRGRVSYISPDLDPGTRTAGVRLEVPNPSGDLKPGMLLEVSLERDLGEGLAVPVNAVLFDGARRVVFVDLGDGRLMPRRVVLGPKAGDFYAVLEGLKLGEVVVTSGTFPIAAEFKLKFTAEQF